MLTVVDYGVGNLRAISNVLNYLNIEHRMGQTANDILQAERLLLPGVGAFDTAMDKLSRQGLVEALTQRALHDKVPVLGICLGMQIMCQRSDEGSKQGLGWFDAEVRRFDVSRMDHARPIPHMGWNEARPARNHPIIDGLVQPPRFYFVHGYHVVCRNSGDELLRCSYGYDFTAGIAQENLVAVQFHPEKSHRFGQALLANFAKWHPACTGQD